MKSIKLQSSLAVIFSRPHDALGRQTGYALCAAAPLREAAALMISRGAAETAEPFAALAPSERGLSGGARLGEYVSVGFTVEYSYDALGHLSAVSSGSNVFTYSYLPCTDLVSGYSSGDFARSVSYEPDRDLVASVENAFGETVISRFDYTNDVLGRRVARVDSGSAFAETAFERYAYNDRSEVVGSQRYYGNNVNAFSRPMTGRSFGYGYDPIGNRISSYEDVGGVRLTTGYEANELNEYTAIWSAGAVPLRGEAERGATVRVNGIAAERDSGNADVTPWSAALATGPREEAGFQHADIVAAVAGEGGTNVVSSVSGEVFAPADETQLSYDADGNMTSDGRWLYTWNGENRLVRAVEAAHPTNRAPRVVEYAYDHRGRMVWKTIGGTNAPLDTALAYVWDDYNIVRESRNGEYTYNVWGLDLNGTLQGCGGVGGLLAVVKDDEVYTPTYDANGNILEYVSSNGTTVAHQEYDPFGNAVVSSGDADAFTHWFSTKPWCGVTGMYEYQYRKYRPGMGRWMSRDSIGETTESLNLYILCLNSTLTMVDRYGYETFNTNPAGNGLTWVLDLQYVKWGSNEIRTGWANTWYLRTGEPCSIRRTNDPKVVKVSDCCAEIVNGAEYELTIHGRWPTQEFSVGIHTTLEGWKSIIQHELKRAAYILLGFQIYYLPIAMSGNIATKCGVVCRREGWEVASDMLKEYFVEIELKAFSLMYAYEIDAQATIGKENGSNMRYIIQDGKKLMDGLKRQYSYPPPRLGIDDFGTECPVSNTTK